MVVIVLVCVALAVVTMSLVHAVTVPVCESPQYKGVSFASGVYGTCDYVYAPSIQAYLILLPNGALSLQSNIVSTEVAVYASLSATQDSNQLTVDEYGYWWLGVNGVVTWRNLPGGQFVYPGLPIANDGSPNFSLGMHPGTQPIIALFYKGAVVWDSTATSGLHYATSRPVGYLNLGVNEYIQSADTVTSFVLNQLDGNVCVYSGTYPDTTTLMTCL